MSAPTTVNSGALDRQVALQRKTITSNAFGEPVETWQDLAVVFAQKIEITGAEAVRADEVAAQITTQFLIRYTQFRPALNPRDRLLFNEDGGPPEDGLVFNIRRVSSVGRRNGHLIDAWARADQVVDQHPPAPANSVE